VTVYYLLYIVCGICLSSFFPFAVNYKQQFYNLQVSSFVRPINACADASCSLMAANVIFSGS